MFILFQFACCCFPSDGPRLLSLIGVPSARAPHRFVSGARATSGGGDMPRWNRSVKVSQSHAPSTPCMELHTITRHIFHRYGVFGCCLDHIYTVPPRETLVCWGCIGHTSPGHDAAIRVSVFTKRTHVRHDWLKGPVPALKADKGVSDALCELKAPRKSLCWPQLYRGSLTQFMLADWCLLPGLGPCYIISWNRPFSTWTKKCEKSQDVARELRRFGK